MWWQLRKKKAPETLSEDIKKVLESQYGLDSRNTAELLCLEKRGLHAGRQVRQIRIFDPSLSRKGAGPIRKYDELMLHREALLFQGYIDTDGSVHLSDWRRARKKEPLEPTASTK
jgi:hypothetical protein